MEEATADKGSTDDAAADSWGGGWGGDSDAPEVNESAGTDNAQWGGSVQQPSPTVDPVSSENMSDPTDTGVNAAMGNAKHYVMSSTWTDDDNRRLAALDVHDGCTWKELYPILERFVPRDLRDQVRHMPVGGDPFANFGMNEEPEKPKKPEEAQTRNNGQSRTEQRTPTPSNGWDSQDWGGDSSGGKDSGGQDAGTQKQDDDEQSLVGSASLQSSSPEIEKDEFPSS